MAHLELWLLQQAVEQLTPVTATPPMVTTCMQLLQSAATQAGHLHMAGGFDTTAFEAACAAARAGVDAAVKQRVALAASAYQLPPDQLAAAASSNLWRLPEGTLPDIQQPRQRQGLASSAKEQAAANLGTLSVIKPGATQQLEQLLPHLLSELQQVLEKDREEAGVVLQLQHVPWNVSCSAWPWQVSTSLCVY
jgi:hypothetical protein